MSRHAVASSVRRSVQVGAGNAGRATGRGAGPRAAARAPAADRRFAGDHLWKANTPDRPWVSGATPQLPEPFTIERVLPMMDEAGVDRVVIVPPTLEGTSLDYAQEAVEALSRSLRDHGPHLRSTIRRPRSRFPSWKQQLGVVGIRLNIAGEQARGSPTGPRTGSGPRPRRQAFPSCSSPSVKRPCSGRSPSAIPACRSSSITWAWRRRRYRPVGCQR